MKKHYFTWFISFLLSVNLLAQHVTSLASAEEIENVVVNFISERNGYNKDESGTKIMIKEISPMSKQGELLFYAVNLESGFVLVAATKRVWPVLAYSMEGNFHAPENEGNVAAWLNQYEDQILFAINNSIEPTTEITATWQKYSSQNYQPILTDTPISVGPFLTSKWNQGKFYNELCPVDPAGPGGRAYAGCVATAMGQVMYYFRHPQTGTGSYSYFHQVYDTISANFGNTTYLWNEMVNQLSSSNLAVAELLFHLGVSVDMVYGPDGSGMYNHKAAYSLRTYFKYAPETQYVFRDSTSMDWDSLLVWHLDRKIPMYYAGWSQPHIYGHAFVVDGYQGEGYYHFNWGWGGSFDGYFYTNELTPGGSNFNLAQELIINCIPDTINYSYPDYCSGFAEFTHHQGTFNDGSGPLYNYAPNSQCSFLINPQNETDSITSITLSFQRFQLEEDDFLSIFDGENNNATLIGTFTGETIPEAITSSGNKLFLQFLSNSGESSGGFFASYQTQKPVWCSGMTTLTGEEGWLSDGSGSFHYNNTSTCMWYINPAGAAEVTLSFLKFDTEPINDVVKVFDPTNNQLLAEFSGYYEPDNLPEPVTAVNGKMFITFTTNSYVRADGWEANYSTDLTAVNKMTAENELMLVPNPASNHVTLIWKTNVHPPQNLEILNHLGEIVLRINLKTTQSHHDLDVSSFLPGLYFVKIMNDNYFKISKLIIH